ncbi:Gephyrin [Nymphon striatum]|nr:Gephyrin [Nymphon striatum]
MTEEKGKLIQILKNNLKDLIFANKSELSDEVILEQLDRKKEAIMKQLGDMLLEQNDVKSKVSIEDVASRPRESSFVMKTMDEAFNCVKEHWQTIGCSIKTVNYDNLHEIVGYVFAEDVYSEDSLPPFPASIKDGYAVIAEDGKGIRKVMGTSTAGSNPEETVVSGSCLRINTGAPIPNGANAVIQIEDTKLLESCKGEEVKIELLKSPTVGQDIRPAGSDINKGDKVLCKNSVIGPGEIATAATIGHVYFKVFNKPTVAVLTTGNEIVEPWKTPGPGQIRDSNKSGLLALLRSQGFSAHDTKIASDDPTVLFRQLRECLGTVDVLVITGGVSMGEKDFVKEVLIKDLGVNIHFGRICMKPGKPTTFGSVICNGKKRLIFGLPGNPVSAMVTAQLFVLPSLRAISGHPSPFPTTIKASLGVDRKLDPRPEYLRVTLHWDKENIMPVAVPTTPHQISSNVSSMVGVNGLAILPSSTSTQTKLEKGSTISVLIIDKGFHHNYYDLNFDNLPEFVFSQKGYLKNCYSGWIMHSAPIGVAIELACITQEHKKRRLPIWIYHRFRGNIIEICKYLHNENVFMLMKKFEEPSSKSKSISVFSQHSFYTNTLIHYTFKKKKSYLCII